MAEPLRLPWPMWRCHNQLLGGTRRLLLILITCALSMVIGFYAMCRLLNKEPLPTVAGWSLYILTGAQGFILILAGCNAVYRAMLRDYDTKMIESHRLSPMSNSAVVLGYLFGATQQLLAVSLLILAFGSVVCWIATGQAADWVVGFILLLNGSLSLWALVIFTGMRPAKPINLISFIVGGLAVGNIGLITIPAVGLFTAAYCGFIGMGLMGGSGGLNATAALAISIPQLVLTVFWLAAASVKYRRPDLPALNAPRGAVLLCLWLTMGVLGIVAYQASSNYTKLPDFDTDLTRTQWIGTMLLAMVVALLPMNGAVHCRALARQGAAFRGWGDRIPDWLVAVTLAVLIVGLMFVLGGSLNLVAPADAGKVWAYTGAAVLSAMLVARSLLSLGYAVSKSPKVMVGTALFVAWIAPPAIDLVIVGTLRGFEEQLSLSALFGASPFGTILLNWGAELPGDPFPGLVFQAILALLLTVFAARVNRRLSTKQAVAASQAGPAAT